MALCFQIPFVTSYQGRGHEAWLYDLSGSVLSLVSDDGISPFLMGAWTCIDCVLCHDTFHFRKVILHW
jgi:hypothetical protein